MLPVNATSSVIGQANAPTNDDTEVGREDFLRMMIAQLQSQDPLEPTDASTYMAQLAQISMLSELSTLNGQVEAMVNSQSALMGAQSTNLIGKEVKAMSDHIAVGSEGPATITVRYPEGVTSGTLTLTDLDGNVVKSVTLGPKAAGDHAVTVDVPPGEYLVKATVESGGTSQNALTFVDGVVDGVDFSTGMPLLVVAGAKIALSDVISVAIQPQD